MESGVSAEVHFAQKLAANEKKTRDRAIKRLNKYLSVRSRHASGLSEPDLLKIWKGLFYCMWMQDKPLIQEELSQRITNLLHCFPKTEDALRFVQVFLETMSREWNGIDRLRLDKFMMIFRDMLHQTFVLLSKGDWQEDDCRTLALSIYQHVMCAHEPRLPDGLKLHLADIFLYELTKVSTEQLTSKVLLILLQPFIEFVLLTNKMDLAHRVTSQIIYKVMKATSSSSEVAEDENADGVTADETDEVDENMEVDVSNQQKVDHPPYPLDKVMFLKLLFDLAGRKGIRASNRALVYKLVKKYSGIWDSSVSSAEQTSGVEPGESRNEEVHNFVCDVRFFKHDGKAVDQQQAGQQSKKRKKKRKNEEYSHGNTTPDSIGSDVAAESSVAFEKKTVKVKKSRLKYGNVASATLEDDDSQSQRSSPGNKNTLKTISDRNNSAVGCARATGIGSRKRKHSHDESDDSNSPSKKKKLKLNSKATLTNILVRKTPKKSNRCTEEIPICESSEEGTLAVDIEANTNSNARPKYRSSSPPKSLPAASTIELVKYNVSSASFLVKKDLSGLQAKPPSPKTHTYRVSLTERSDDTNVSEDASLPLEKQPTLHNHDGSIGFNKTSLSVEKIRVSSELPKSKFVDTKSPVFPEVRYPDMSVPIDLVIKTPQGTREEETASPSSMSLKKKVIFDLRRNKANKFQDYLKSLAKQPEPPYEPTKSPAVGILKSPVISPAVSTSSSETSQLSSKKGVAYGRMSSAPVILVNNPSKTKKKSLFNTKGRKPREQSPSVGKGKKVKGLKQKS